MNSPDSRLTDAKGLLAALWEEGSRPSLRWLRSQQKANAIPYIKLGHRVFFDPDQVRAALLAHNTVRTRSNPVRVPPSTSAPPQKSADRFVGRHRP